MIIAGREIPLTENMIMGSKPHVEKGETKMNCKYAITFSDNAEHKLTGFYSCGNPYVAPERLEFMECGETCRFYKPAETDRETVQHREITRLQAVVRRYEAGFEAIADTIRDNAIHLTREHSGYWLGFHDGIMNVLDALGLEFGGQYIRYKWEAL